MRRSVYSSFTAITAPRQDRPELVARFRRAGLTQKQTAETLGIGQKTVQREEPEGLRGQRGPSKTGQMSSFGGDVIEAEIVDEEPRPTPPVWVVPDDVWEPSPNRHLLIFSTFQLGSQLQDTDVRAQLAQAAPRICGLCGSCHILLKEGRGFCRVSLAPPTSGITFTPCPAHLRVMFIVLGFGLTACTSARESAHLP